MRKLDTRTILAYIIIGTYTVLTIVAIVYPIAKIPGFDLEKFSGYFSKVSSPLTGLVGVVVGYYFAKTGTSTGENGTEPNGTASPDQGPATSPDAPSPVTTIPVSAFRNTDRSSSSDDVVEEALPG